MSTSSRFCCAQQPSQTKSSCDAIQPKHHCPPDTTPLAPERLPFSGIAQRFEIGLQLETSTSSTTIHLDRPSVSEMRDEVPDEE